MFSSMYSYIFPLSQDRRLKPDTIIVGLTPPLPVDEPLSVTTGLYLTLIIKRPDIDPAIVSDHQVIFDSDR